ncbi:MAG: ImuA family protein [Bosea sp. (in: a-proteobacteria)]
MIVERSDLAEPSAGSEPFWPEDKQLSRPLTEARLATLRGTLARLEGTGQLSVGADISHFSLGTDAPELGLRRAALHEITAREAGDGAAALAFALALALRASLTGNGQKVPLQHGRMLIVMEGMSGPESGLPYGHGLASFGLDPERLLLLCPRRAVEALWAIEEGLRCGALTAVIGIFARLPRAYDLTASRRLVLAARSGGIPAILAIIGEGGAGSRIASAAETRWQIAARPSANGLASVSGLASEPTNPAFTAELLRRRGGEPATFDLDWNHDTRDLSRPPLSLPLAAASANRPGQAARAG